MYSVVILLHGHNYSTAPTPIGVSVPLRQSLKLKPFLQFSFDFLFLTIANIRTNRVM